MDSTPPIIVAPVRGYVDRAELSKLRVGEVAVRVFPVAVTESTESTRVGRWQDLEIGVLIWSQTKPGDTESRDALMSLGLHIHDMLAPWDYLLNGYSIGELTFGDGTGSLYDADLLAQQQTFVSLVSLTVTQTPDTN